MGLIGKAMLLGGGYFIAKKLLAEKDKASNNNNNNNNRSFDQQDQAPHNQQDNYHDQNRSQQDVYRDQKDFAPAPIYREAQPQIQYNDSASQLGQKREMSSALNGERYYGNEKARSDGGKSFN